MNGLLCCFILLMTLGVVGLPSPSVGAGERQEPIKIGALNEGWGPTPATVGLRDGLLALGYREGEQFTIGVRFTQGDVGALPAAARELVRGGADIIFATTTNAVKAAQAATTEIPIVFAEVIGDVIGLGIVRSFAQPGGNVTGVTNLDLALNAKRLELFKEIVPGLKRILFPYSATDLYAPAYARAYREAAQALGIILVERAVRTLEEATATLAKVRRSEVDGIISASGMGLNLPGLVLEATSKRQVPTMFNGAFYVERGALASYGPDFHESGRQAARLVAKIIKGEKPGQIPVEIDAKIELVINLKVAKALGLKVGAAALQRVDRVIE
jgi:putative ABC transport system substrate-binding protein